METVEAKLSKGSRADPAILFVAVSVSVFGFSFLYETDFWGKNDYSWEPLVITGIFLFFIYFYRRIFSGNHQFALVKDEGSCLIFQKAAHILASGWILGEQMRIAKDDIANVKIDYLFSGPYFSGIFWICFSMKNQNVIEYWVKDREIVERVKVFATSVLANADLIVGERV